MKIISISSLGNSSMIKKLLRIPSDMKDNNMLYLMQQS